MICMNSLFLGMQILQSRLTLVGCVKGDRHGLYVLPIARYLMGIFRLGTFLVRLTLRVCF